MDLSMIQVGSTVVLVLVTIYYAYQTRKTVQEMSLQRKEQIRPIIIAESFHIHKPTKKSDTCNMGYKLKNVGNGPAFNVRVSIWDVETKEILEITENDIDVLENGQFEEGTLYISKDLFSNIKYSDTEMGLVAFLDVKIAAHTFYGEHYATKQGYFLEKGSYTLESIPGTFQFVPDRTQPIFKKIFEKLKKSYKSLVS